MDHVSLDNGDIVNIWPCWIFPGSAALVKWSIAYNFCLIKRAHQNALFTLNMIVHPRVYFNMIRHLSLSPLLIPSIQQAKRADSTVYSAPCPELTGLCIVKQDVKTDQHCNWPRNLVPIKRNNYNCNCPVA